MRGAAEEIRREKDDELRRPYRLRERHLRSRPCIAGCGGTGCERGRAAHQQRDRDHDGRDDDGKDLHRGSPVIAGDEPGHERRHGHRCHPHAG